MYRDRKECGSRQLTVAAVMRLNLHFNCCFYSIVHFLVNYPNKRDEEDDRPCYKDYAEVQ